MINLDFIQIRIFSLSFADAQKHVLGVDCASVSLGHNWKGIHFSNVSRPSLSKLSHLTVKKAGVEITSDGVASLVPSIYSTKETPQTMYVYLFEIVLVVYIIL